VLKRIPFLRGTCPWILTDFRSPRRPLPGIQDFYNRKGLTSDKGDKKKAFFVMQRFYRELAQGRREANRCKRWDQFCDFYEKERLDPFMENRK
jgi:beta-glucuronidase